MKTKKKYLSHPLLMYIAGALTAGTIMYGTAWGLVMNTNITRDVPFLKKVFITQFGDFSSTHTLDLDDNGIKLYNAPINARILTAPNGIFGFEGKIYAGAFAPNSILSGHIVKGTLELSDFGISLVNNISATLAGVCPPGQVLNGFTNGSPSCVPAGIGGNICGTNGYLQGWSSTGMALCGGPGGSALGNGVEWHVSTTNPQDIFYGTLVDDNDGNVAIGVDSPSSKLHVKSTLTGMIIFTGETMILNTGGTTINPKPCPYVSGIPITSSQCTRQHGICGSSYGQNFLNAPTSNLCQSGAPTAVSTSSAGGWQWWCTGINGGNNSGTCVANKTTNGQCGSAHAGPLVWDAPNSNLCSQGNPSQVYTNARVDGAGNAGANYSWNCNGINGGSNANCWRDRVVHGQCVSRLPFYNNGAFNPQQPNSRVACQGVKWHDPYYYIVNHTTTYQSSSYVEFTCKGINGGEPAYGCATSQSSAITYAGCAGANGGTFSSTPTSNLCYGTASSVSVINAAGMQFYKWTCSESGKRTQTCYARKQ